MIPRDTLPIPLLFEHQRAFAHTEPAVHMACSACRGDCPTPEACQLPIAQATKPPLAAFWLLRVITAARLALLRWQLDCLRDERERYESIGWVGPVYLRNCDRQELELVRAINRLTQEDINV